MPVINIRIVNLLSGTIQSRKNVLNVGLKYWSVRAQKREVNTWLVQTRDVVIGDQSILTKQMSKMTDFSPRCMLAKVIILDSISIKNLLAMQLLHGC